MYPTRQAAEAIECRLPPTKLEEAPALHGQGIVWGVADEIDQGPLGERKRTVAETSERGFAHRRQLLRVSQHLAQDFHGALRRRRSQHLNGALNQVRSAGLPSHELFQAVDCRRVFEKGQLLERRLLEPLLQVGECPRKGCAAPGYVAFDHGGSCPL